jgi:hypothetical protein
LREGLVFAGLLRGGPPGQSPPNRCESKGERASNSAGNSPDDHGARRGWNREGADSPAEKPVAKTGPGAQERFPCPSRSPETLSHHLHLHTISRVSGPPGDALLPARSRARMRSHGAALSGNRRRPGTLSRFAELHPTGFDFSRDRQEPPTESLRIASMSGLQDRFSTRDPHAPRPKERVFLQACKAGTCPFTTTFTFTCPS